MVNTPQFYTCYAGQIVSHVITSNKLTLSLSQNNAVSRILAYRSSGKDSRSPHMVNIM